MRKRRVTRQEAGGGLSQLGYEAKNRDILGNQTEVRRVSVGGKRREGARRDEGNVTLSP